MDIQKKKDNIIASIGGILAQPREKAMATAYEIKELLDELEKLTQNRTQIEALTAILEQQTDAQKLETVARIAGIVYVQTESGVSIYYLGIEILTL